MGRLRPLLAALALLAGLQEAALRAVFPQPEVLNFDRAHYSHLGFVPDGQAPARLGHASFTWSSEPDGFEFVHRLNLYGFRDGEWQLARPTGGPRLFFVGDSFVEGFSASGDDTLPHVFGELLAAAGHPADVLNLGLGGGNLEAYARLMRDAVPLFRPDAVLLVLFANDVIPVAVDRLATGAALAPRLASPWQPRALYVGGELAAGRRVPRRWVEPPFPFLPRVPDPRNPWSDGRRAGRLSAFVEPAVARAIREGLFNPMLPEALRWFGRSLLRDADLTPQLRTLRDRLRRDGARLWVAYLPTKHQVSDRYLAAQADFTPPEDLRSLRGQEYQRHARQLARSCQELGVPFLDTTPALRAREDAGQALYWHYDDHMNAAGYRATAEEIAAWWQGEGASP